MLQPWFRRGSGVARSIICRQCRKLYSSRFLDRGHDAAQSPLYNPARYLQNSARETQSHIPLRQQLKQEAKALKSRKRQKKDDEEALREKWELTVGIEIHAQLDTGAKLFSSE